jgi:hypothetical protein
MFVIVSSLVAIALGMAVGCVPILNQHLHWNFWIIVPLSGMIFGLIFASMQFAAGRLLQIHITIRQARLLSIGIVLAYFTTDIGIYLSAAIPISNHDSLPDGLYPIRDLVSFLGYMSIRLGSASMHSLNFGTLRFGETGTIVHYLFDLLGAGLGAFFTFQPLISDAAFCKKCARYMKATQRFDIYLLPDEDVDGIRSSIRQLGERNGHDELALLLKELPNKAGDERCRARISSTLSACRQCGAKALTGRLFQIERNDWLEVPESAFSTSRSGP